VGEIPQRKISTARRLIKREHVGWHLRYLLRAGEIPSAERASKELRVEKIPSAGRTSKELRVGKILAVELGSQSSLSGGNLIIEAANLVGLQG